MIECMAYVQFIVQQERGPYPYIRTKELLFRWIELSAFGSALFRTHVGSSCNPINKQVIGLCMIDIGSLMIQKEILSVH